MCVSDFDKVMETIFGRWRSQILYAGVKLGIFESVGEFPKSASSIAQELGLDPSLSYRLLRALASMGFLSERNDQNFSVTPMGTIVRKDHPHTLRGVLLLEEGPEHYAIWKHLVPMVEDGKQDGFVREFGLKLFDYVAKTPPYSQMFNEAMSSYSAMQSSLVLESLKNYDFSKIQYVCDVGGGYGHLLCSLLLKHPHLIGKVVDIESVVRNNSLLLAERMGIGKRCMYVAGDMFKEVPKSDAYIMKLILHDWNEEECARILSNIYKASPHNGKVLIAEHVVQGPETPHFSKLFDIHMMCALTGRERTENEYARLLEKSGFRFVKTHYPESKSIGVVEGVKQ
jgi:hypothetical protein